MYAGCKSYITTFTETLSHELEGTGVQVQALCPGIVRGTEFHGQDPGFDQSRLESAAIDAQGIVQASLQGLRLREVVSVPGLDDPALVAQIRSDERALLGRAARGSLAARYTE